MKWMLFTLTAALALGFGVERSELTDKEEITKSISFPPGGSTRALVVDNIRGSIEVVGYDGDELKLVVHRTSYGDSEAELQEAKKKITLEITEGPGRLILYVDAPWRCNDGKGIHYSSEDYGYDAAFDFELKVPRNTDCTLKTINDGSITASGVTGRFEVRNVNGAIDMAGITGSGTAKTVNGNVSVRFDRNPEARCGFATVNGTIDVTMRSDLSADLRLKTFNGEVYTDFDVTGLPHPSPTAKRAGHRTTYRSDDYSVVRAGEGGPELDFETLNGDIRILKLHQ